MESERHTDTWRLAVALVGLVACTGEERTVVTRSPYGDPTRNYVLDGDFELSVDRGDANAQPWFFFDAQHVNGSIHVLTGGRCASGVFCVALGKGESLVARGVVIPPHAALTLSVQAKPDSGTCGDLEARLLHYSGDGLGDHGEAFHLADADGKVKPDGHGWCQLRTDVDSGEPRSETALQIYATGGRVVVDRVVLTDRAAGVSGTKGETLDLDSAPGRTGLRHPSVSYTQRSEPLFQDTPSAASARFTDGR